LYRLLTGHLPFESRARDLTSGLTDEPQAPSSRAPERLRKELRGDLDAIVLKALRSDAMRRYASVDAFAQDLEAFLGGRVVLAHRGSRWYRTRKIVQQHKAAALGSAVLLAGVLLGAGVALWQASITGHERDRARAALLQAEQTLAQTSEVGDFLMELFRSPEPAAAPLTADDLLRRGVQRANALAGQPVLQARMFDVVGQMHHRLGRYQEAETLLARAADLRRSVLGADHPDVAESLIHLARVHRSRGRRSEERSLIEDAVRIRLAALAPADARIAEALDELSWFHRGIAQEQLIRRAIAIYSAAAADARQLALMQSLSTNLRGQGRLAEAVTTGRAALALARSRLGPTAAATGYAMIHLADHVRDIEQDYVEAERLYRGGLQIQAQHHGATSTSLLHGLHSLAELLDRTGKHAEAEDVIRRVYAIRLAVAGPRHPGVARATEMLSENLARQGRGDEARRLAHEALRLFESLLGRSHLAYADGLENLATVHAHLGDWEAAVAAQRAAIEHESTRQRNTSQHGTHYRRLGRFLLSAGRLPEAETEMLRSLSLVLRAHGNDDHPNVQDSKRALYELYTAWRRPADAERYRVPPAAVLREW
jgi:tetratricopeptide (TPR) repeat protein